MQFVLHKGKFNYSDLITTLPSSSTVVYISTYNIALDSELQWFLKKFGLVHLVVNPIPFKSTCEKNEDALYDLLKMKNIKLYLNRNNHSKIIVNEDMSYVGSANLSKFSQNNIESGFISKESKVNLDILDSFKRDILSESSSFNDIYSNYKSWNIYNAINKFIPEYKKLEEMVGKSIVLTIPVHYGNNLKKLDDLIDKANWIKKQVERSVSFNQLNITQSLSLKGSISGLTSVRHKINQLKVDGEFLNRASSEKGLDQSQTTMLDIQNEFGGCDAMDRFLRNTDSFTELREALTDTKEEMEEEIKNILNYLYALIYFGNLFDKHKKAIK